MGKLHEVIAVEKDIRSTAAKIVAETNNTFGKKHQLFSTHQKLYEPLKEGDPDKGEEETAQPITTIGDKLSYFETHMVRLFDAILQKEDANSKAKEDIVIFNDNDKVILAEKVPVSALVQLENIFEEIRTNVYDTIPTLDPTKRWVEDKAAGAGRYLTDVTTRLSSKKIQKPLVLHPGNDKHPPQVQLITEDTPVGNYKINYFSGMISPADKSALLRRVDQMIEAIKKARARANDTEVVSLKIGKRLFKYINEGK